MTTICINLKAHIHTELNTYSFFDIGQSKAYVDDLDTRIRVEKLCDNYYLPRNNQVLDLIARYPDRMKVSYTISGVTLELLERYRPDVIASFKELGSTGNVEFVCQPYYHSLSLLYMENHFKYQVSLHRNKIKELFGVESHVMANTAFTYHNKMAGIAAELGLVGVAGQRSNSAKEDAYIYNLPNASGVKCLLHHDKLVNDWKEWSFRPVNNHWGRQLACREHLLNIFMDFEQLSAEGEPTFYYHFFEELESILQEPNLQLATMSEVIANASEFISNEGSLSSEPDGQQEYIETTGNFMQKDAIAKLYELENLVIKAGDKELLHLWSQLQDCSYFNNMSIVLSDNNTAIKSPYDHYINFMNIISDLELRLNYVVDMHDLTLNEQKQHLKSI